MIPLRETLENFQAYMLEKEPSILNQIITEGRASREVRLNVYSNAYYLRLIEILEGDFPILCKLLGEEKFNQFGRDYVNDYPSNYFSVGTFSRNFSKFLASNTSLDPIYAEIANLEWHLSEVLYAANAKVLTLEDLKKIPAEEWINMKLTFHPSVRTLYFSYNAPEIYKACNEDQLKSEIKQYQTSQNWLVWRRDLRGYFCSLTSEENWIRQAIERNQNFGEICEGLCEFLSENQVGEFAATTLSKWISEGMFRL